MRVLVSCLLILLSVAGLNAQEEEPYVKLEEMTGSARGQASGTTVIQYYGYSLKEIFKALDTDYAFEIQNKKLRSKKFSLDVLGDLSDKDWIIEEINNIVAKEGYDVKKTDRHPRIYGLGFEAPGVCENTGGEMSSESEVNSNWEGKCVTVSRMIEKIIEWHPEILVYDQAIEDETKLPKIKLKKSNLKDLQQQLADQGIYLKVSEELSQQAYITNYR